MRPTSSSDLGGSVSLIDRIGQAMLIIDLVTMPSDANMCVALAHLELVWPFGRTELELPRCSHRSLDADGTELCGGLVLIHLGGF